MGGLALAHNDGQLFLGLMVAVLYAQQLPLVAQDTVRYLFPPFPLAIYGLARVARIRRVLATHRRLSIWTFAASLLVDGQVAFVLVVAQDLAVGEAVRLHAIATLALAGLLGLPLSLVAGLPERGRSAAVALGVRATATTVFVLPANVVSFPMGRFAVPVV